MASGRSRKKSIFSVIWKYIASLDFLLIFVVLAVSLFSVVVIRSATGTVGRNVIIQFAGICIGLVIMVIVSLIDYERLCEFWLPIAVLSSIALFLTAVFADEIGGNKNWLNFGIINVQTSEFTKMAFAITMGAHIEKIGSELNRFRNIILLCLHFLLYFVPVVLQKDIGSSLIYLGAFIIIMFIAGIRYLYLIIAGVGGVIAVPVVWSFFSEYQKARILYGLQPELDPLKYGYQPLLSRLSIGSGGLFGQGLGQGIQTQNSALPADHTDFIYAVVGEEFGFIGCVGVLFLIFLIVFLIGKNGVEATKKSGFYICIMIASMIMLQTCINIGMCIGVSPVIGITLPFMSYGGSSVLSLFIGLGLVMSVRRRPEKTLKFAIKDD